MRAILRALLGARRALLGFPVCLPLVYHNLRACLAFLVRVYAQWARACPVSFDLT